jgi:hypothetical protein
MTTIATVRTFWETMTCRPGRRLVREWLDAEGRAVRFVVVKEEFWPR